SLTRATRPGATSSSSATTEPSSASSMSDASAPALPSSVGAVLRGLWEAGHAAYVVGGGIRDALLGRPAQDWDVATGALPERIREIFPDGRYENRFGTVTVPSEGTDVEVTTFRRDHQYADHRRP